MSSVNRLEVVTQDLTLDEYRELAEFRHRIRCFQGATEENARTLGIDPDSYLLLLTRLQGLPEGSRPTIQGLADRLARVRGTRRRPGRSGGGSRTMSPARPPIPREWTIGLN